MTRVMVDGAKAPTTADELEAQALAEVRGYERTMKARAEEAFPDQKEPIRIYGEGLAYGGVAFLGSLAKITRAAEVRFRGLFSSAESAAEAQRKAADAQFKADHAKAMASLADRLKQTVDAAVATDRRSRGARAYGLAGVALLATFAAGMLVEHWRGSAAATHDAAASLEQLQQQASAARQDLADTSATMGQTVQELQATVAAASGGLAVLRAIGSLPPAELEAAQAVIAELGSADYRRRATAIAAVREAMSIPPERRRDAVEFARTEDPAIRANFIEMAKMADARRGAWWTGESPHAGCLVNGPVLPVTRGQPQPTCLVALPLGWAAKPDANLRNHYKAQ